MNHDTPISLAGCRVGFALTGSFCTFSDVFTQLKAIADLKAQIFPIFSDNVYKLDTRFFMASEVRDKVEAICGRPIWHTLMEVEPIGPRKLLDLLIIAPCTGNTIGKLASSVIDTPVTMAAKSQLRNGRPVLLAISTNDGLSMSASNIGTLLSRRDVYFVPYGQDDPYNKPASLVAHMELIPQAALLALEHKQMQPLLRPY